MHYIIEYIIEYGVLRDVNLMSSDIFANIGTNVSILFFEDERRARETILIDVTALGV